MSKPKQRLLPTSKLSNEYVDFLDAWDVQRGSTFLPPEGEYTGAHIWAGKIVDDETIVIGAADKARTVMMKDTVMVGLVNLDDIEDVIKRDLDPLIAYTDAATYQAIGLKHAIWLLDLMRGLPDRERGITKSPFMEDVAMSYGSATPQLQPRSQIYHI